MDTMNRVASGVLTCVVLSLTVFGARSSAAPARKAPASTKQGIPQTSTPATRDEPGWRGARWGMSASQVAEAIGSEVQTMSPEETMGSDPDRMPLKIPSYVIGIDTMSVSFESDTTTQGLGLVLVSRRSIIPRTDTFERLGDLLTRRYGPSTSQSGRDGRDGRTKIYSTRQWVFPTTTVELSNWYEPITLVGAVAIRYFPTKDASTRKL